MENIIIIPSYEPKEKLINIVKQLKENNLNNIIVIDDGSTKKDIFNKLDDFCQVVHHEKNEGKGAAIKTGVNYAISNYKNIAGFVFLDGDGQHLIKDVKNVSNESLKTGKIVLGIRDFSSPLVPKKSKFGNKFSSIYFKITTGIKLNDTQTGLRAIPYKYKEYLLNTEGKRYEYEMNFLMNIARNNIYIKTVPIETVYEDNNKESHFHAIRDSYLIYKEFIRFIFSAVSSSVIDVGLFYIFAHFTGFVFWPNIVARILSGIYNYTINKHWCFKSNGKYEYIGYFILFFIQMFASSLFVKLLSFVIGNLIITKMLVDLVIFIVNYIIQKRFIFRSIKNV